MRILISTDMPGRRGYFVFSSGVRLSREIFSGTRWVILVKFPEALLGGIRENSEAA